MSEEIGQVLDVSLVATDKTRQRLVIISLLFTYSLILWIVLSGDPANSLHSSALAWSFGTNIAVMFAYSFGTLLTKYLAK